MVVKIFFLLTDDIASEIGRSENLPNNSIVNSFITDDYDYNSEHKRLIEYRNSFQITCSTVQGHHKPTWKAEFFGTPNFPGVISSSFSETIYSDQLNPYVTNLNALISEDTSGIYMCESSVSGVFLKFILTSGKLESCVQKLIYVCTSLSNITDYIRKPICQSKIRQCCKRFFGKCDFTNILCSIR